jgi:hypothetical protein
MSKKQAPSKQQPVKYLPTVLNAFRQGFILLAFLVYLLGPANAAPVQAAVYTLTAYNDCVGTTGGNTTADTVSGTTSGLLRNYETGANTPVTVTVTRNGSINTATSSGAYSNSGTDAYNTFNGRANMAGVINYASSNGWYVDLTFTGLDPTKTYTFATTANRADSGYTSRVSQFTISDITAATNASTSGVTVVSNESVAFSTGYNTVNGYVARWTGIQPGSDGDFAVRTNAYPFNSTYYGYGPSVFMLAEEDLSPNITTSGALTAFTAMPGEESATQTFSVSGENLTQDITITAPEGFQLSTDGSSFSSTLTLRQTGGIVATTTVYARLYSATEGSFSGNITLESTGAVTRNIAVSGVVSLCPTVSLVVAEDTHMRSGSTRSSYNYGGSTTLRVNPYYEQGSDDGQLTGALLKWDIAGAGISDEVQVSAASLTFNVTNGSNYAYGLYNMRRAWVEGTNNAASGTGASWNYYGAGTGSWGTTGAQNTETDRYNTNLWDADASDFNTTGAVTFDLNASGIDVVQGWIDGTITNNGLTIQNYSGTTVDVWEASSSEATTAANRPRLNVTYCYPTDPTIRAVGTLNAFSSQPGVPSAPQSYTVSGRNLNEDISIVAPANFEISTSSDSGFGSTLVLPQSDGTVAATPVYVRFNRATIGTSSGNIVHSSAGATVVNKAVSGTASNTASVTFQYGAGGYTGTVDTFIRGTTDGNTNYGANTGLEWDENSGTTTDEVALVRFNDVFTSEGGVIPDGATILSATLTYMTTDLSGSSTAEGDPANVYESLVDWDGSTVTWNTFGGEPGVQADEYYASPTSVA